MNNQNEPKRNKLPGGSVREGASPKNRASLSKKRKLKYKPKTELSKKVVFSIFSLLSVFFLALCLFGAYSYAGESIKISSQNYIAKANSSKTYTIVYSDSDPWGYGAAVLLRDMFAEKTGSTLRIVSDSEPVGLHELRIGHTNRASDDYITSSSALGTDGYAILISQGNSVSLSAFSEAGATAAIKYFISSYVGSYQLGTLTLSNKLNFSYVSTTGEEPDATLCHTKITLTANSDGTFKLLVLSDPDTSPYTIDALRAMIENENPSLVVFAGDVSSGMTTKAELEQYLKELTSPLESSKTPWAVTFGEQDTYAGLSADLQMEVYSSFSYCVSKKDFSSDGTISSFIPVYAYGNEEKSGSPIFGIWTLGQTSMLSLSSSAASSEPLFSGLIETGKDYGYVPAKHLAWFSESSEVLDRTAGGKLPSLVICHTPVEEFDVIVKNPGTTSMHGNYGEPVSASPINSGLFSSILDAKNILGLYCGHDHLNSFSGKYCGIELGYCASIGYNGYGAGGTFETNNSLRGGRIVEIKEKENTISLSSYMVFSSDYGIGRN